MKNTTKNSSPEHSIKNRSTVFIAGMSVACMSLVLAGCGQSGALYIPNTPEAAQRSTVGDILTKPASTTPAPTAPTTPATPAPAK